MAGVGQFDLGEMLPDIPGLGQEGAEAGFPGETVYGDFVVRSINCSTWVTPHYYEELVPIGSGAYGAVW